MFGCYRTYRTLLQNLSDFATELIGLSRLKKSVFKPVITRKIALRQNRYIICKYYSQKGRRTLRCRPFSTIGEMKKQFCVNCQNVVYLNCFYC